MTSFVSSAQQKHALVVAIGDYPVLESGKSWKDLSSLNDVVLLKEMLSEQGFPEGNTNYLLDQDATVENLDNAFETLISNLKKDDIVYFHYSGHGQQIADVNGKELQRSNNLIKDETDGRDEALVLYNAPYRHYRGYEYEHHYADDQLNEHITAIRQAIGKNGQIVVVIDACHSGSATRGDDEPTVRGTDEPCVPDDWQANTSEDDNAEGFGTDFTFGDDPEIGKLVAFFGCKAEQVNREYRPNPSSEERYGSLTYFFIRAMKNLTANSATYENLFSEIRRNVVMEFNNAQQPVIEGDDLNQLLFSGDFIVQEPYYLLEPDIYATEATLQAGQLQGIMKGDSIALFNNTIRKIEGETPTVKGVVTSAGPLSSVIRLEHSLPEGKDNGAQYRVFKTWSGSLGIDVRVKLDVSGSLKGELKKALEAMPYVHLENKDYQYLVKEQEMDNGEKGVVIILGSDSDKTLRGMAPKPKSASWITDTIVTLIKEAALVNALRRVSAQYYDIEFKVSVSDYKTKQILTNEELLNLKSTDAITLFVENTGELPFYLSLINVASNNKISVASDQARAYFQPGQKKGIASFELSDIGIDQYIFVASTDFIDLKPFEGLGSDLSKSTRGSIGGNFFTDYINDNVAGTRGAQIDEAEITIRSIEFDVKENDKNK